MTVQVATSPPPPDAAPPGGAPRVPAWDAITESVVCPLCGYNLRGLTEPRCPECGYRFEWEPLLDPTKRLHPYLFEHHPERNVRSFVRTMLGGLLPRRFWRSLQPAQPSRPGRLVLYWVVATALAFAGTVFDAGRSFYEARLDNEGARQIMLVQAKRQLAAPAPYGPAMAAEVQRAGGVQAWVDRFHPPTFSRRFVGDWCRQYDLRRALRAPLVYALWPWLTLATLMIFAASMRRA